MLRKLKNLAHWGLAVFANLIYWFPGRRIRVIGVTGTDGKTTTTSLIYHVLKSAGRKAVTITTIGAEINGKAEQTGLHVTTPTSFAIQRFLRRAVDDGNDFAVLETSSHGIDQHRIWGIPYEVAAITNITHEHLDYHRTFQAYVEAKLKFLKSARAAVINLDDPVVTGFRSQLARRVVTYSRTRGDADLNLDKFPYQSQMFGSFNQSNVLAAVACLRLVGLGDDEIRRGLATFQAPSGRQEIAFDSEFKVMVDFAHTPNAVESILREAKATNPIRLIHLFGAPGRRDVDKRGMMGQASAKYADIIILTADDPRDERVEDINARIRAGISAKFALNQNLFDIPDRREAISKALGMARPGDFVLLTGKGHEPTLALADRELPWNEVKIVKDILGK